MNYQDPDYRGQPGRSGTGIVPHAGRAIETYDPNMFGPDLDPGSRDEFNFWDTLQIILNRKWLILTITLLGVSIAAILTLQITPLFRATTTIEIQNQEATILESTLSPTVVADEEHMSTQFALLQSRSLAERVAENLNLADDPLYANQALSRDLRVKQAAGIITRNIRVDSESRSRVISVQFISPYPRETARIANALVETFIQTNLERRYNTTAYARQFIEERLATTKLALEASERELVQYASNQDILDLGVDGSGRSLDENSIVSLNDELAQAESARIQTEQRYREASSSATSSEILNNPNVRQMRNELASLESNYRRNLTVFKPDYPDMVDLQIQIDSVRGDIELEKRNILSSLEADFRAASARESSLRQRVEELKGDLLSLRDRRIEYTILSREVDTNRAQYEALLARMKEVSIASGIGSSEVSVIDPALVPGLPFQPNLPRSILQAIVLSLATGIGLAFLLNYIDDTIKSPDDMKSKLGLPTIGVVPTVRGTKDIVTSELQNPKSGVSEAFFSARTALEFTTETGTPRSILITSTRPGEGKTSSTVALAMAFAKVGKTVLIIDADMRKPSFVADVGSSIGLSGMLTRDANLEDEIIPAATPGLHLLPAGIVPPNPAELLSSPRLKDLIATAEDTFDVIIVDSPPVLSFTDAPLLGSICEATLLAVQAGTVRTPAVQRTVGRLLESRSNIVGGILTRFDAKKSGYHHGYYSYAYGKSAYAYQERKVKSKSDAKRKIKLFTDDEPAPKTDKAEEWFDQ
ncbi:MAG: polysaccharide biosynthesis tyrosine autokinase [Henriciella sp.]|nr:polysaccharide biosynthesis tyrosine autokinase [Henriciella sp.]